MKIKDLLNVTLDKIENHLDNPKTSRLIHGKFYVIFSECWKSETNFFTEFYKTAKSKTKCGLILLSKRYQEVGCRLLDIETGINHFRIANGRLPEKDFSKISGAVELLTKLNVEIVEMESCEVFEIIKECERLKNEEKCKVIFIDSLDFIYCACWLSREEPENEIKNMDAVCHFLRTMVAEENDIAIVTSYTTKNDPCKLDLLIERAVRRKSEGIYVD